MRSRVLRCAGFVMLALFLAITALAQQTDIHRYDVYAGFAGFETPWLNLAQRGFHSQAGENLRPWLSVGFDYSEATGHNALTPSVLKPSLQQELGAEIQELILAGEIPPNYQLIVPMDAFSETFALGPQLDYRHWRPVTLFVRPSLGAIRQRVTPHPTDPVSTAIIAQLAPAGYKLDWQGFYGFGGGLDWNATNHFAIRAQPDLVYWDLFNDLLAHGSWTTRYSIGLTCRFGRNIAQ
ncbi:MAG TPA: hypothetical protein VME18_13240 [Acidobacteriaceae bacterium]|nr:hypothetical protein [Acidobacteriaceae bacterium]